VEVFTSSLGAASDRSYDADDLNWSIPWPHLVEGHVDSRALTAGHLEVEFGSANSPHDTESRGRAQDPIKTCHEMRAPAEQTVVSATDVAAQTLSPPPRSEAGTEFGYSCDPSHQRPPSDGYLTPLEPHSGCPGWWPNAIRTADIDGWRCGCSCHQDGAGWPGHETHLANRFVGSIPVVE